MKDVWATLDALKRDGVFDSPPPIPESTRIEISDQWLRDPLLREFVQTMHSSGGMRLQKTWHALGEQRSIATQLIIDGAVDDTDTYAYDAFANDAKLDPSKATALAFLLYGAHTFLWREKVFDLVNEAPLPPHVIGKELIPFPVTYHSHEVGYKYIGPDGSCLKPLENVEGKGILIYPIPGGVMLARIGVSVAGIAHLHRGVLMFGSRYPDDIEPYARPAYGQILRMLAFLNSPYTATRNERIPRAMRRRAGGLIPNEDHPISVVILRSETASAVSRYEKAKHERSIRWWVRGHYRAQWYPSDKEHRVIWIAPYLKGPEDAPVKPRVYSVQR